MHERSLARLRVHVGAHQSCRTSVAQQRQARRAAVLCSRLEACQATRLAVLVGIEANLQQDLLREGVLLLAKEHQPPGWPTSTIAASPVAAASTSSAVSSTCMDASTSGRIARSTSIMRCRCSPCPPRIMVESHPCKLPAGVV